MAGITQPLRPSMFVEAAAEPAGAAPAAGQAVAAQ